MYPDNFLTKLLKELSYIPRRTSLKFLNVQSIPSMEKKKQSYHEMDCFMNA